MKAIFSLGILTFLLFSCSEKAADKSNIDTLANQRIDSLEKLVNAMKPGLGEIMLGIQTHHAKLYYAGKNANWDLAQFEMDEISELLEMANKVETDRPETASLSMLFPILKSLNQDIAQKKDKSFETDFTELTNTCNACHQKTHFEFNVITIPTNPPVSNQRFALPTKN